MEQKKVDFMNEWLKGVFTFIKGKKLESSIIKFGHMSYHVFAELGHRLQDFAEGKYADAFNQQFSSDNNTK